MPERLPHPEGTNFKLTYKSFYNLTLKAASHSIPRGYRKHYVRCWDTTCSELAKRHDDALTPSEIKETATALIDYLDKRRERRWIETVENIDMKHSSRKAWSTIRKLTGTNKNKDGITKSSVKVADIAKLVVDNGKYKNYDRAFTRKVNKDLKSMWNSADSNLCNDFSTAEMDEALKNLNDGKAPGPDYLHNEFLTHLSPPAKTWLMTFLSHCLKSARVPNIWKSGSTLAVLKPQKPPDEPRSYRPISLLCVTLKLFERLILNRISPVVESVLPNEQAGFRPRRCTLDQVALMTENIETAFEDNKKVGAVFVDLSSAYDTVWLRGLTLKLLKTIPNKNMVEVIMETLRGRNFTLQLGEDKSKRKLLRNGSMVLC